MLSLLLDVFLLFWWTSILNRSHGGAYIGSRSNRAVGEKAVSDSNNAGQTGAAPNSIVGLIDECISSVSELAVGDQPMICLNITGSTDERSWSEPRKMLSVQLDRRCL